MLLFAFCVHIAIHTSHFLSTFLLSTFIPAVIAYGAATSGKILGQFTSPKIQRRAAKRRPYYRESSQETSGSGRDGETRSEVQESPQDEVEPDAIVVKEGGEEKRDQSLARFAMLFHDEDEGEDEDDDDEPATVGSDGSYDGSDEGNGSVKGSDEGDGRDQRDEDERLLKELLDLFD
ncbi:hypothetical protein EDB81DRAFT_949208 [Dactylonectria macrodidyma]|uniref:Uncharacterized protein n=1 Tax=Dactylonectria macrodidyma TaxID=307937 RepID=A0A9P9EH53_9HYPO|nr:hypothetical protein EDB81DRAFT_949208 [Dactylonectria macrodidyma]